MRRNRLETGKDTRDEPSSADGTDDGRRLSRLELVHLLDDFVHHAGVAFEDERVVEGVDVDAARTLISSFRMRGRVSETHAPSFFSTNSLAVASASAQCLPPTTTSPPSALSFSSTCAFAVIGTKIVHSSPRARAACVAASPAFPPDEETRCARTPLEAASAASVEATWPIPLRASGVSVGEGWKGGDGKAHRILKDPLGWVDSIFK